MGWNCCSEEFHHRKCAEHFLIGSFTCFRNSARSSAVTKDALLLTTSTAFCNLNYTTIG